MSKLNITDQGNGCFAVSGDLTFATIDKESLESFAFLTTAKDIIVDLSAVSSTDSAGLALMIEWIKYTRSKRTQLHFKKVPNQLLTLAKLSGFDQTSHFNSA